jgi:F420-non-reducing hydrogenase large subunit
MNAVTEQIRNESAAPAAETSDHRRRVTIEPITRLEGHGRIEIFLDGEGDVEHAYLQIPELRGFEVFSLGRPAEDMPQITSRICGVCPTAHHMAATKALDDLYKVEPTPTARKIRELVYNAFMLEDHALHVYVLGGPDFIVGPQAPAAERNLVGVIGKVGVEVGKKVIGMRRRVRDLISYFGGKVIHPVLGLPGGVSKGLAPADLPRFQELAKDALDFALFTNQVFHDLVLKNPDYVKLITSDTYTHRTYYMGLVDPKNRVNFYDGQIRVVDPSGREYASFPASRYRDFIAERTEPWSYMKFCYLRPLGWNGFADGPKTSIYAVAPLARLNVADGMATPLAQQAYEEYFNALGGKPVHHTLANHWARVIEMIQAAETMVALTADPELAGTDIRTLPTKKPSVGIGVVEAPRGTLFHHYKVSNDDLVTYCNLIVSTTNNNQAMNESIRAVAARFLTGREVTEGLLNHIEVAIRAYDPCLSCATHALGQMPLEVDILDADGALVSRGRKGD